jgi:hypothetical protein
MHGIVRRPVEGLLSFGNVDDSGHQSSHFSAGWQLPFQAFHSLTRGRYSLSKQGAAAHSGYGRSRRVQ